MLRRALFLEMKVVYNVSCVRTIAWLIFVKEGDDILIFKVLEYGAEYDAESNAESKSF